MEPKLPNEDLLQIFLYDYLKKRRLFHTAEIFKIETQLNGQLPNEFDLQPHGFLYNFWNSYYDPNPRQPNVGAAMNTAPQIIRDRYSIRHISGFRSFRELLSCDISSDGNIVASGGHGKKPYICYPGTTHYVTSIESHLSTILEVRFQSQSHIFATASADKTVKLWDANRPQKAFFDFGAHDGEVRSLDFRPLVGTLCSSGTDNVIKVWDLNRHVIINSCKAGGRQVRFQPESGSLLAVANRNVIDIYNHNLVVLNNLLGHVGDINSICWDVTGRMIASISDDGVCVWSVFNNGQCLYQYPLTGRRFHSVIFHPQYNDVLVIGGFKCLELLILENGRIHSIPAADVSVTGLATTTAQSQYIASVSQNYGVNIWK